METSGSQSGLRGCEQATCMYLGLCVVMCFLCVVYVVCEMLCAFFYM